MCFLDLHSILFLNAKLHRHMYKQTLKKILFILVLTYYLSLKVPLSLAIRVTSLRGTLRLHIKPPPSDQLWYAFTCMPDIDFNLESSVGEHKITNGHIALFLVNRLKVWSLLLSFIDIHIFDTKFICILNHFLSITCMADLTKKDK